MFSLVFFFKCKCEVNCKFLLSYFACEILGVMKSEACKGLSEIMDRFLIYLIDFNIMKIKTYVAKFIQYTYIYGQ